MKMNVGGFDRLFRIFGGAALLAWFFIASGPTWALIGVVPLLTGMFNYCPAYTLFGINTCKTK